MGQEEDGREDTGAAEAALRKAEAEGLTLQPSDNAAGYRGVFKDSRQAKPFQAAVRRAAAEAAARRAVSPRRGPRWCPAPQL